MSFGKSGIITTMNKFDALHGVYAAAVTPLRADFTPDIDALPLLLDFLSSQGCHGALLLGTTGEGPSFSFAERSAIFSSAATWRRSHPDFKILAGTGSPSLQETIDFNRAAFSAGLDGVVTLPPYYYRTVSDDGLFAWFSQVIMHSVPAGKGLFGYHIPKVSGVALSMELLERLVSAFPDQFAGIKDSSGAADHAVMLGQQFGNSMLILTGNDGLFTHALQNQAGGCITAMANIYSPLLRKVWDSFQLGNADSITQSALTSRRDVMDRNPPAPALLKAMLADFHDLPDWPVRPPLLQLDKETRAKARTAFKTLDS